MGDRENLPYDLEVALRNCMLNAIKSQGTRATMSLDDFKRKFRARALSCIGFDSNCHLNQSQWEFSWAALEGKPGLIVAKRKNGKIVYRWIGSVIDEKVTTVKEKEKKMQKVGKPTAGQRMTVAEALAFALSSAPPEGLPKKEAWRQAFERSGIELEGRILSNVFKEANRHYRVEGYEYITTKTHFVMVPQLPKVKKVREPKVRDQVKAVPAPATSSETVIVFDDGTTITVPSGKSFELKGNFEVKGTTPAGVGIEATLNNAVVKFVAVSAVILMVILGGLSL
jgi:hypothetical protein